MNLGLGWLRLAMEKERERQEEERRAQERRDNCWILFLVLFGGAVCIIATCINGARNG